MDKDMMNIERKALELMGLSDVVGNVSENLGTGLLALVQHLKGPGEIKIQLMTPDDEKSGGKFVARIYLDGVILYGVETNNAIESLTSLGKKIIQTEKIQKAGDNHKGCHVCTYILTRFAEDLEKAAKVAAMFDKVVTRAALGRKFCQEKGWPDNPFELNEEQQKEMCMAVDAQIEPEA